MHKSKKTHLYWLLMILLSTSAFTKPISKNQLIFPMEQFGYAKIIKLSGQISSFDFYIPVSKGWEPVSFQTNLTISDDVQEAYFEVWNGDTPLFSQQIKEKENAIQVDLTGATVHQNTLNLTARIQLNSTLDSCEALFIGRWGALHESTITFGGELETPHTLSDFLPPIPGQINISIPEKATLPEVETAIYLSQMLSSYYRSFGQTAPIAIVEDLQEATDDGASSRFFVIERATEAGMVLIDNPDQPTIVIRGEGQNLIRQAKAYADQNLRPILISQAVFVETFEAASQSPERIPFYHLSSSPFKLSGMGELETNFFFTQADLGGPIKTVAVHMSGVHTPIPEGVRASIEIRYNNQLLISDLLDKSGKFEVFFEIPERLFERDSDLRIKINYPPEEGRCEYGDQKFFTFDVDEQSYLEIKRGQSLPASIQRFPQVWIPHFQITMDRLDLENIQAAAAFLNLVQSTTKTALQFSMLSWEEAQKTDQPLLVVAAPEEAFPKFNARLQMDPLRILQDKTIPFSADMEISDSGWLQTTQFSGKDVLILSYAEDPNAMVEMVNALSAKPSEWYGLTDDVIIYSSDELIQLDSAFLEPERFSFIPQNFSSFWYRYRLFFLSATSVLVLAFVIILLRGTIVRRSASKELLQKKQKEQARE